MPWVHVSDEEIAKLRVVCGARYPELTEFFADLDARRKEGRSILGCAFREAAHHCDGEIEVDDDAPVSLSEDGGAYVMSWQWVDSVQAGIVCKGCGGPIGMATGKCKDCDAPFDLEPLLQPKEVSRA